MKFQNADCLEPQWRRVCITSSSYLKLHSFDHIIIVYERFPFREKQQDLLFLCSGWLPRFRRGCGWLIPGTWLGCEKQKQIRAGARPNKDQQSVSIPRIVRYPSTTHRDIPQRNHKYKFNVFIFQRESKCNTVVCVLSSLPSACVTERRWKLVSHSKNDLERWWENSSSDVRRSSKTHDGIRNIHTK